MYVPEQTVPQDEDGNWIGALSDLVQYTKEEKEALADKEKADAINAQVHQFCPLEEQLKILREQVNYPPLKGQACKSLG